VIVFSFSEGIFLKACSWRRTLGERSMNRFFASSQIFLSREKLRLGGGGVSEEKNTYLFL
mgnify:CR=1